MAYTRSVHQAVCYATGSWPRRCYLFFVSDCSLGPSVICTSFACLRGITNRNGSLRTDSHGCDTGRRKKKAGTKVQCNEESRWYPVTSRRKVDEQSGLHCTKWKVLACLTVSLLRWGDARKVVFLFILFWPNLQWSARFGSISLRLHCEDIARATNICRVDDATWANIIEKKQDDKPEGLEWTICT